MPGDGILGEITWLDQKANDPAQNFSTQLGQAAGVIVPVGSCTHAAPLTTLPRAELDAVSGTVTAYSLLEMYIADPTKYLTANQCTNSPNPGLTDFSCQLDDLFGGIRHLEGSHFRPT